MCLLVPALHYIILQATLLQPVLPLCIQFLSRLAVLPPAKCFRGKPLGGFHTFCEPALGVSPLQWSTVHWQLRRRLLRQMTRSRMARTLTMLRKCTGTGGMIPSRSMPHGRSISRVWSKGCLVPRHSNLPRLWLLHPQTVRRPSTQLEAQSWTITSK